MLLINIKFDFCPRKFVVCKWISWIYLHVEEYVVVAVMKMFPVVWYICSCMHHKFLFKVSKLSCLLELLLLFHWVNERCFFEVKANNGICWRNIHTFYLLFVIANIAGFVLYTSICLLLPNNCYCFWIISCLYFLLNKKQVFYLNNFIENSFNTI